jgi:excinuclease UvrABC helicase subunit UvrB
MQVLAAQLWAELRGFFPHNAVEYFVSYYDYYRPESYQPTADVYLQKTASVNEDIDRLRHAATAALLSRTDVVSALRDPSLMTAPLMTSHLMTSLTTSLMTSLMASLSTPRIAPQVVVASVSCIYGLGVPDQYQEAALPLRVGHTLPSLTHLLAALQRLQYEPVADTRAKPERGEYSLTAVGGGGSTDYELRVHPVASEVAVRVRLALQFPQQADHSQPADHSQQADHPQPADHSRAADHSQSADHSQQADTSPQAAPMAEVAGGGAVQVMAIMRDPISEAPTSALIDEEDEIAAVLAVAEATAAADGAGAVPSAVSSAVDELVLFPASHHVLPESERARVLHDVKAELDARLASLRADGRLAEATRLEGRVCADLEDFVHKGYCKVGCP